MATKAAPPNRSYRKAQVLEIGLLNVSVDIFTATITARPSRKMFTPSGNPVKRLDVDGETGQKIEREDIIKKCVAPDGQQITVDDATYKSLGDPHPGRIKVLAAQPASLLVNGSYLMAGNHYQVRPTVNKDGSSPYAKPYETLCESLRRKGLFLLCEVNLSSDVRPAVFNPLTNTLHTLQFTGEVREDYRYDRPTIEDAEVQMMDTLISATLMSSSPLPLEDKFTTRLEKYLDDAASTAEPVEVAQEAGPTDSPDVSDLMAVLMASVEAQEKAKQAPDEIRRAS